LDASASGQGPNKPSGSIKGWEFLDLVSDYYLLKDSAPWNLFSLSVYARARAHTHTHTYMWLIKPAVGGTP
jgi:hypothetical protein